MPWYHGTMMEWYIGTVLSSRLILIAVGVSNLLLLETVVEESKKCLVFHNDWSFIVQWQRACCDGTKREMDTVLNLDVSSDRLGGLYGSLFLTHTQRGSLTLVLPLVAPSPCRDMIQTRYMLSEPVVPIRE